MVSNARQFLESIRTYTTPKEGGTKGSLVPSSERPTKLATVATYSGSYVFVTYDGESTPSAKGLTFLSPYEPLIGDRVLLIPSGATYVVAGAVSTGGPSQAAATPIGALLPYAGFSAPPRGFLVCDGSAVSRSTYVNLFNVIGATYGSGDGSTTFNLPNMQGNVVVGTNPSDSDFTPTGKNGGAKATTHGHTLNNGYALFDLDTTKSYVSRKGTVAAWTIGNVESTSWSGGTAATRTSGVQLAGQTDTNGVSAVQPYVAMNYIIRY